MINTIWVLLIGLGIFTAIGTGQIGMISTNIFSSAEKAVQFTIGLAGLIAFWSGILKIAEEAGLTKMIAKLLRPVLKPLFPTIPGNHPVLGLISLTIAANLLGLGNVATPIGLKAITELQKFNASQEQPSNEICTFLTLVLGGLSLLPSTLIAIRAQSGSLSPAIIIGPIFIITSISTLIGIASNYFGLKSYWWYQRKQ